METIKYDISTSNGNDQILDLGGLGNHEFMQGDPLTQASYVDLGMEEPSMVMAKVTDQERRQHDMMYKQQHRISELIFHLRQMSWENNAVGEKSPISSSAMPAVIHDKQMRVRNDEKRCHLYNNKGQRLKNFDRRQFQNGVPVVHSGVAKRVHHISC